MDAKAERIMTIVVVAIVATMLMSFVFAVVKYKNGDISDDSIFMIGMLFSASITVIVVVYGAIVLNNGNSASDMYRKYVEEREKEKRQ